MNTWFCSVKYFCNWKKMLITILTGGPEVPGGPLGPRKPRGPCQKM